MRLTDWTTMSCKRAARLLPLHAAGDLPARRAGAVESHLARCAGCRRAAGEFAESRRLVAEAFAPPEFGEKFYELMRRNVLDRIGRDQRPAPTPRRPALAALFTPRFAYAAALALAVVACGLALYRLRDAGAPARTTVVRDSRPTRDGDTPGSVVASASPTPLESRAVKPPPHRRAGAPKLAAATKPSRGEGRASAAGELVVGPGRTPRIGAPTTAESRGGAVAASAAAAEPGAAEVSRIEIQTADPTIRIIWLAPQKLAAPAPHEPKDENGERE